MGWAGSELVAPVAAWQWPAGQGSTTDYDEGETREGEEAVLDIGYTRRDIGRRLVRLSTEILKQPFDSRHTCRLLQSARREPPSRQPSNTINCLDVDTVSRRALPSIQGLD